MQLILARPADLGTTSEHGAWSADVGLGSRKSQSINHDVVAGQESLCAD